MTRSLFIARLLIPFVLGSTTLVPVARAQDPAVLFDEGRVAWEEGRCEEGLPLLEQAVAATDSPNARLYVGRCLRDLGRLADAYEQYARTVRDADRLAATEERYARTRDQAAAERAQLELKVALLVVALDESLRGAEVRVGGAALASDRVGVPTAFMPGATVVEATSEAGTVRRELTLEAGRTQTVTLSAGTGTAPPPVAPPPAPPPSAPPDEGGGLSGLQIGGIGALVVGAAGFAVFGVGTAMAEGKLSELEEGCGEGPCTDPAFQDTIDSGKSAETLAGVGIVVGIAGVLAGVPLLVFGGDDGGDEASVGFGPGGVSVGYRGAF